MRGWCLVAVVLQGLLLGPCAAADWRIGVDQGVREARLGIGFGSPEVRSEFSAADLPAGVFHSSRKIASCVCMNSPPPSHAGLKMVSP